MGLKLVTVKYTWLLISKTSLRYATKDKNLETALFTVQCEKNSRVHKKTLDIITWKDCRFSRNQVIGATFLKDWIIEEI